MNTDYSKVLQRLLEYRKQLHRTQEEMAKQFGVNQGHYSKLELGSKIISYKSLECFEKSGSDVYYLLTGENIVQGDLDKYLVLCKTEQGQKEFYSYLIWLIRQGIFLIKEDIQISMRTVRIVELAEKTKESPSIWKAIRDIEHLTQVQMAEKLDVNIKRYRRIEKMESAPDAEILNTLFCKLNYSPFVIMKQDLFYLDEMNRIWGEFPTDIKEKLVFLLQKSVELINMYEEP